MAGLGRGVISTGRLDPAARDAALAGLKRFAALVALMDVTWLRVVATAAVLATPEEVAADAAGGRRRRRTKADGVVARDEEIAAAIEATLAHYGIDAVSGHFHDTYGQALSNTLAALDVCVWNFQSSIAGLGGCPYAKGATGNVATEDVLYLMQGLGIETGVDLNAVVDAGQFIAGHLGRRAASRVGNAIAAKRAQ